MPLYVYSCPRCQQMRSDIRCIDQRHDGPLCDVCIPVTKMELVIGATPGIVKNPAVPRGK